jgi:hypothetical protein
VNLSPQGKELVERHSSDICDCIVALAANADGMASKGISTLLQGLHGTPNDDDKAYHNEMAHKLSASLCNMSHLVPSTSPTVIKNRDLILPSLMDALLDSTRMRELPTLNCSRIGEKNEKHFDLNRELLEAINNGTPNQRRSYKRCTEVWQFCADFAEALSKIEGGESDDLVHRMGVQLTEALKFRNRASAHLRLMSIEKETFKRMLMLTSILSASTTNFELLCFRLVAKSSTQMAILSNQAEAAVSSDTGDYTYNQALLIELYSSVAEVHVSLLCWIINQRQCSTKIEALLKCICNEYFVSLLQGHEQAASQALQEMIRLSLRGQRPAQTTEVTKPTARNGTYTSWAVLTLRWSLLRRSKELFLCSPGIGDSNSRLLSALTAAGTCSDDEATRTIARSLSLSVEVGQPEFKHPSQLPLSVAVDDFMASESILGPATMQKLWLCKHKVLTEHLFLRLRLGPASQDPQSTKRIIRLAGEIMEADSGHTFLIGGTTHEVSLATLRVATQRLVFSLRASLEHEGVDDDLVAAIIFCARALAVSNVAYYALEGRNCDSSTVARWSKESSQSVASFSDDGTPNDAATASYVWYSLLWINSVAALLAERSVRQGDKLREFQALLTDQERWPLIESQREQLLRDLTTRLFPRRERASTAVNIYAKPKNVVQIDEHNNISVPTDCWRPNGAVSEAAKRFLAALIHLS